MPAKGATGVPRRKAVPKPVRYRRPDAELVRRWARRVVRGEKASFASQEAFRAALLAVLRSDEPQAVLGGPRLRKLLVDVPGVRIGVRYTEREDDRPLTECPVCGSPLRAIHNRTLGGETVVLGQRCTRCAYWTHRLRRIPVRYTFSKAGIDGRPSA